MTETCKTCKNAIFDPVWGEYKCSVLQRRVRSEPVTNCRFYKKGKPAISKEKENERFH